MQRNAEATMLRGTRETGSGFTGAPSWKGEADDESAARQLHFSYWPVITVHAPTRVTARLLQRWLQERSASMAPARPVPGFRVAAGVLTKADRFVIAYAASALENMQSSGIAGCAVIHLSIAGLTDPLLPVYVVSKLQQHGVSLLGVTVALAPHWPGDAAKATSRLTAVAEFASHDRRHSEGHHPRLPSSVGSLLDS